MAAGTCGPVGGLLAANWNAMNEEEGIAGSSMPVERPTACLSAVAELTLAAPLRRHPNQMTRTDRQAGPCP
jgi:hypothetical protein